MEIKLPENDSAVSPTATERRLSANLEELEAKKGDHTDQGPLLRDKLRFQFKIIDYGLANFDETFAAGPDVVVDVRPFLSL